MSPSLRAVLAPNGTEDVGFTKKDVKSDNTAVANDIAMVKGGIRHQERGTGLYTVCPVSQGHRINLLFGKIRKT
jgi:hypothetical protein